MSSPLPLPVQPAAQGGTGIRPAPAPGSALATESEGDFGEILGGELQLQDTADSLAEVVGQAAEVVASLTGSLPQDGNPLPVTEPGLPAGEPGSELTLQASIEGLAEDGLPLPAAIPGAGGFELRVTDPANGFGLQFQASGITSSRPEFALQFALDQAGLKLAGQFTSSIDSVELQTSGQQGLPEPELDLDGAALFERQTRHALNFQNLLAPANRQADFGIDAGQVSRVLEQFAEPTRRGANPVQAPGVTLSGLATPLSETGMASSSSGVNQMSIDVPLQSERWQQAFSQRVVWSIGNNQSAELRIHPEELGKIDIKLNIEHDKANVVFNTQHGAVKDAIESALPRLREMLADQGIDLGDVDVQHEEFSQQFAGNSDGDGQERLLNGEVEQPATDSVGAGSAEQIITTVSVADDAIDYYI